MDSLWDAASRCGGSISGTFFDRSGSLRIADIEAASTLGGRLEPLRGRSVLLATSGQLSTALALLELDGVVRRLVLCTPDLTDDALAAVAAAAEADVIIGDAGMGAAGTLPARLPLLRQPVAAHCRRRATERTEWVLLTSGTTGMPKLVVHTLHSLAGALPRPDSASPAVWSTFYDIRRYGGLQIYLRAVLCGASLLLSSPQEPAHEFLARAAAARVTHISGTPSHWRLALLSGDAAVLDPEYLRLSGEVADQSVLDGLRAAYPAAGIAHAFASTEAGLAFDVNDGLAGFPADLVHAPGAGDCATELRVVDGTLRIRSERIALRYLGGESALLAGPDGFVDTGDLLELVSGRYYFRGRRGGIINVGGLKVYPEEVEAVLNADARVRMSLVRGRRNPITGAIVVADVVLVAGAAASNDAAAERIRLELLHACRRSLPPHKVPALLRFVAGLEVTAAGKLVRPNA